MVVSEDWANARDFDARLRKARRRPGTSARRPALLIMRRQRVFFGEIAEAGQLGLELQLDRPGRPVALLAEDHFGAAVRALHIRHPGDMLGRAGARLLVLQIIFLAEDE